MTVKHKIFLFSIIFALCMVIIGAFVYVISIRQLGRANWKQELSQLIETKKLSIQTSVNKDITLALKWADSSITKAYFTNPENEDIKKLAFDEFDSYKNAFSSNVDFWVNDIDKNFYSNGEFSYTIDPNNESDYWYKMTLYETEKYNFNINYNENLDQTNLWINAPVFNNKKPVGVVGTGIVLDSFISSVYESIDPNVHVYFFNKKNEITGSGDKDIVTQKLNIIEFLPEFADGITNTIKSLNNENTIEFQIGNNQCIISYLSSLDWYIFAYVPLSYSVIRNSTISNIFYIMFVATVLIIIIYSFFVIRLTSPLHSLQKTMMSISNGDFSASFDYKGNDELGSLSKEVSHINSSISQIIKSIHSQSYTVHDTNTDIQKNLSSCSQFSTVILSELKNASTILSEQQGMIKNTTDVTEQSKASVLQLEEKFEQQANIIHNSAEKIREMLECVANLEQLKNNSNQNMKGLSSKLTEGTSQLKSVINQIDDISSGSTKLLETNRLISSISEQTNLLAMNASIEAAHAGESGKGFAVVAGEIRTLAEKTRKQSEEVEHTIKEIIQSVENVVSFSETTNKVFGNIVSLVQEVNKNFNDISIIIENQNNLSTEISSHLTTVAESSSAVSEGFVSIKEGSISTSTSMLQAERQTQELVSAMDGIQSHANDISEKVAEVSVLANTNDKELSELDASLLKYTVL